jgi:hypothetical protein
MIRVADSQQLKLPDRKEITLCEAVTSFVYGKASDVLQQMLYGEAETDEHSTRAKDLVERLHSAAYAGRIKFRGLKNGGDDADGYKDIDRLYFSESRGLRWDADEIWCHDLSRDHPKFKSRPPFFTMDWHHVHIDREHFEALLREMGVSVQQIPETDAPGKQKTFTTGAPGRPTSKHLVKLMAQRKLDEGYRPESLAAFSRQLAKELAVAEPAAAPMTPKTVGNAIRELWHARQKPPKIIDRS